MKSTKPYLIRAIHEWCADQGFTPYLSVKVDASTRVPREFVKNGEIVLNVGLEATHQLSMGNEEITFQARFGGKAFPVVVPIERVAAIYASENGEGMAFRSERGRNGRRCSILPRPGESPATEPDVYRAKFAD
jgi:stringent starvation protein B